MINILPKNDLNYGISSNVFELSKDFTEGLLLLKMIGEECVLPISSENGELIASIIRENGLKVFYKNGKIRMED